MPVTSALSCGGGDGGAVAWVIIQVSQIKARPVMGAGAARRPTVSLLPTGAVRKLAVVAVVGAACQARWENDMSMLFWMVRLGSGLSGRSR